MTFLVAPVLQAGHLLGAPALEMKSEELGRVIADRTGLGIFGKTVLALRQQEDEVLVADSLRPMMDAGFFHRIHLAADTLLLLAVQAVRGCTARPSARTTTASRWPRRRPHFGRCVERTVVAIQDHENVAVGCVPCTSPHPCG